MSEHPNSILMELHYLPSVQYFTKLVQYDKVIIEQHENYTKGSYRNRCHIAGANGLQRLSIPLKQGKNNNKPIKEVAISYETNWQHQHWLSIISAYGNAPFFEYYVDEIAPFFKKKYTTLFELNWALLVILKDLVGLNTNIALSLDYEKETSEHIVDFRNKISPKAQKIVLDKDFNLEEYPQVFKEKNGFLANLSILDLLFCTGPQSILYLENSIDK